MLRSRATAIGLILGMAPDESVGRARARRRRHLAPLGTAGRLRDRRLHRADSVRRRPGRYQRARPGFRIGRAGPGRERQRQGRAARPARGGRAPSRHDRGRDQQAVPRRRLRTRRAGPLCVVEVVIEGAKPKARVRFELEAADGQSTADGSVAMDLLASPGDLALWHSSVAGLAENPARSRTTKRTRRKSFIHKIHQTHQKNIK